MSKITQKITLANAIRGMLLLGLVALFFVLVQSCQQPKTGLKVYATGGIKALTVLDVPPPQPTLTFSNSRGDEMRLSDYKGKVVLVNVWATWCPPCVVEMPMLNDLQALRGGPSFEVVNISLDRTAQEATDYLVEKNLGNLQDWHDSTYNLPSALKVPGLPVTIIYDRQGREVARLAGEADWVSPEALLLIDKVLE